MEVVSNLELEIVDREVNPTYYYVGDNKKMSRRTVKVNQTKKLKRIVFL